ncbi:hypothetical protein LOC67_18585 [Stieleria sp. JC731]|uniref:hypothetical protein n=1 Tax=Pirellulaceae TaxID=2691357 RepID=UPI001E63DA3C|nr:hypothetical protein [Stieleria sp. JC731]MCC9602563.1 hypothetical protein [Stieleria sp. JC731]
MSEPVQIDLHKQQATIHLAVWAVMSVLSLVLSVFGIALLLPKSILVGLFVSTVGVMLFTSALLMSLQTFRTFKLKEPVLEFSEIGFLDRRICAKQVPWPSMRWKSFPKKTGAIQFELDAELDEVMIPHKTDKIIDRCFKLLKLPRYTVSHIATGKSTPELEEIFRKFKLPIGEEGDASVSNQQAANQQETDNPDASTAEGDAVAETEANTEELAVAAAG